MNTKVNSKRMRILAVILCILITVTFMPQMGIVDVQVANAAAKNYKGMDWELTDGTLKLGKADTEQVLDQTDVGAPWLDDDWNDAGRTEEDKLAILRTTRTRWPWFGSNIVKKIEVLGKVKVKGSMSFMFANLPEVTEMTGMNNFDVSEATDMTSLFGYVDYLGQENEMLYGCPKLEKLDLSEWVTTNVRGMPSVFMGARSLTELKVDKFDTRNVENMWDMFYKCTSLKNLDLSSFRTPKVKRMERLFMGCTALEELDISNITGESVENAAYMFRNCSALKAVDVENLIQESCNAIVGMFYNCHSIQTISGMETWNTKNITSFTNLFRNCSSLEEVEAIKGFDTRNVTSMGGMFCMDPASGDNPNRVNNKITQIDLTGWNTKKNTTMNQMFYNLSALTKIDGLDSENFSTENVKDMFSAFRQLPRLESLNLSRFDTRKVTSFNAMFMGCSSIAELDLSSFDISGATNTSSMLRGLTKLTSIDLSNFDTSKLGSMSYMFIDSTNLKEIKGLEYWDTGAITNMNAAFRNAKALASTGLLEFNTAAIDLSKDGFNTEVLKDNEGLVPVLEEMKTNDKYKGVVDKLDEAIQSVQKLANPTTLTKETALEEFRKAIKAYAYVAMIDATEAAYLKLEAAVLAEDRAAQAGGAEAEQAAKEAAAALDAAAKEVGRVVKDANITADEGHLATAAELQEQLNVIMSKQVSRLKDELASIIASAKGIDTSGNSAVTAKALADAIINAETAMKEGSLKELDNAKKVLGDAIMNLEPKSAAEKAGDAAMAKADAAKKAAERVANGKTDADLAVAKNALADVNVAATDIGNAKKAAEDELAAAGKALEDAVNQHGENSPQATAAKKRVTAAENALETVNEQENVIKEYVAFVQNIVNKINATIVADKDPITPGDKVADEAKVDSKLLAQIGTAGITTTGSTKKKTMTITFKKVKNAVNYRITWRKQGAKNWSKNWTAGKTKYVLKKLKVGGLYEFKLAPYAKKDGVWVKGKDSKVVYRYLQVTTKLKAKALKKKRIKVTWKKTKGATGYQIRYSMKKNMKGAKIIKVKKAKKVKYTIKKLKKGKTYYIQIRPYKVKAKKTYIGVLSGKKRVKVKK